MIAAALASILLQQTASSVVWETPEPAPTAAAVAPAVEHTVPAWGLADPFGYERARCSPLVRGAKPLETCQSEVREQLALALGADLPEALRPAGMAGDCEMIQGGGGGSPYALQCGPRSSNGVASPLPQEMDCRPRPVEGGFSSECRPVDATAKKGLSLKLWGGDKD